MILTSRPGQYRTEIVPGLTPCETWDYVFYGTKRARFVIAALDEGVRIRIVDETPPAVVNEIPSKFLEKFDSVAHARAKLRDLVSFGGMDMSLVPVG